MTSFADETMAQAMATLEAMERAGIDPDDVGYFDGDGEWS